MEGTKLLKSEHENIRLATRLLKEECVKILEGKEVDTEWFTKMITFCRNYADKYHHGKEEKILFRIMIEELGTVAEKLIRNGMLVEHDLGRFHIAELENAVKAYEHDKTAYNKLEIVANASEYASLLNRHMDKEDTVVYTFAERSLNDRQKEKVSEEIVLFEQLSENDIAIKILEWLKNNEGKR